MLRRSFSMAACGALVFLLAAAETAPAQVAFFPLGRGTGAVFGPRGGFYYPGSPGYAGYGSGYSPAYGGYSPYYGQPYYSSYSTVYSTTPMYYGAASMAGYSAGASTPHIVSPPAGYGLRANGGASEAAYTAQSYPVQSPDYTNRYPIAVSAAVTAAMADRARDATRAEAAAPERVETPAVAAPCPCPGR